MNSTESSRVRSGSSRFGPKPPPDSPQGHCGGWQAPNIVVELLAQRNHLGIHLSPPNPDSCSIAVRTPNPSHSPAAAVSPKPKTLRLSMPPGPSWGWRAPFVVVALPTILLAILTWYTVPEPKRGATEAALQACTQYTCVRNNHRHDCSAVCVCVAAVSML